MTLTSPVLGFQHVGELAGRGVVDHPIGTIPESVLTRHMERGVSFLVLELQRDPLLYKALHYGGLVQVRGQMQRRLRTAELS